MIHLTGLSISTTFSLEKIGLFPTISFGKVNFSLGYIILYLGELGPTFGKTGLTGGTCPDPAFSLEGVNLPLGEKTLFLEEHSLNQPVSFSLRALNLPHRGVGLSTTFSLGGTNSSSKEFDLPFGENFLSLENWFY